MKTRYYMNADEDRTVTGFIMQHGGVVSWHNMGEHDITFILMNGKKYVIKPGQTRLIKCINGGGMFRFVKPSIIERLKYWWQSLSDK